MSAANFSLLHQQLLAANRANEALLDRIQELELELARVKGLRDPSPGARPVVPVQVAQTPSRPRSSYVPATSHSGPRHKRTETPEQRFVKLFTPTKLYTVGIEPQDDRGLLHDFFEDIRKWAIRNTTTLSQQELTNLSSYQPLVDMFGGKSDIQNILKDREMRQDIVAALMIRDIVHYALGETSLFNSNHIAGRQCRDLVTEFALLFEEDFITKHKLSLQQEALYKDLYEEHGHKEWRTRTADERTDILLTALSPFLGAKVDADGQHRLGELYVKGYRIGIRLRSSAVKWQILFPVAGMQLDLSRMVNRTLNLAGDPMTTWKELANNPSKYFVRFAITPTITKSDFSQGYEVKEVVHSSLVHVARKDGRTYKDHGLVRSSKYGRRN